MPQRQPSGWRERFPSQQAATHTNPLHLTRVLLGKLISCFVGDVGKLSKMLLLGVLLVQTPDFWETHVFTAA